LHDFVSKNGGAINEYKIYDFYKKYPECWTLLKSYKALLEIEDLLSWRTGRTDGDEGMIECKIPSNQKLNQRLAQIQGKLTAFRNLEAMNSFDMKLKQWLETGVIVKETFRSDFSKICGDYRHYTNGNISLS
jgi:hypothetical protein